MNPPHPVPDAMSLAAHARFVRALAHALASDPGAADDAAQETMIAAISHHGPPVRSVRAWLAGVLRNKLRMRRREDARRAQRETVPGPRGGAPADPADEAMRRDLVLRLAEAVRALPEPYQSAVFLRFYEELTPGEIAARQGVPVATVHTRLRRAIERLRVTMDERTHGDRRAWMLVLGGGRPQRPPLVTGLAAAAVGAAAVVLLAVGAALAPWPVSDEEGVVAVVGAAGPTSANAAPADTRRRDAAPVADGSTSATPDADDAAPTIRLRGVVEDALSGDRVAGATVAITFYGRTWSAVTDASGIWRAEIQRLDVARPGDGERFGMSALLAARAPGRVAGTASFSLPPYGGSSAQGRARQEATAPALLLDAVAARVSGRVADAAGKPVPDADVEMRTPAFGAPFGFRRETLTTDAAGRFGPIDVAAGKTEAEVHAAGHPRGESSVVVSPGPARDVAFDIVLPASVPIRGVVVGPGGAPVEGAMVGTHWQVARGVPTGADGRFVLPVQSTTYTTLYVRKSGWMMHDRSGEHAHAGDDVVLTMRRTVSASGRVLLADGSPAPAGLRVWAQPEPGPTRVNSGGAAWTTEGGRFVFPGLFPIRHTLSAGEAAIGYATGAADPAAGASLDGIELRLDGTVTARVRVVDAVWKTPVANALIGWRTPMRATTAEDGRFELRVAPDAGQPPRQQRLVASAEGYAQAYFDVAPARGGPPVEAQVELEPAPETRVSVVDSAGRPVAGARILVGRATPERDAAWTDPDGHATFRATRFETAASVTHPRAGSWTGVVAPGGAGEVLVRIEEARTVRQQVVNADGRPVITAYAVSGGRTVAADDDGWIPLAVGAGATVSAPGHATVTLNTVAASGESKPGDNRLGARWVPTGPLVLPRTAAVTGRVRDADGRGVANVKVHTVWGRGAETRTDGAGRFRLEVPEGEAVPLRVDLPGDEFVEHVWTLAGGPPVDVTLPANGRLRLTGLVTKAGPSSQSWRLDVRDPLEHETVQFDPNWRRRGDAWIAEIPAGRVRVRIRSGDESAQRDPWFDTTVVVAAGAEVVLAMPTSPVTGRVGGSVTTPDGTPIADAHVIDVVTGELLAQTDALGAVGLIENAEYLVPAARVDLRVEAGGRAPVLLTGVDLAAGGVLGVRMDEAVTSLRGRVKGVPPGVPAGATPGETASRVRLITACGHLHGVGLTPDGTFEIEADLAPGPAVLEIFVPGRLPATRAIVVPREGEVAVSLE